MGAASEVEVFKYSRLLWRGPSSRREVTGFPPTPPDSWLDILDRHPSDRPSPSTDTTASVTFRTISCFCLRVR